MYYLYKLIIYINLFRLLDIVELIYKKCNYDCFTDIIYTHKENL